MNMYLAVAMTTFFQLPPTIDYCSIVVGGHDTNDVRVPTSNMGSCVTLHAPVSLIRHIVLLTIWAIRQVHWHLYGTITKVPVYDNLVDIISH